MKGEMWDCFFFFFGLSKNSNHKPPNLWPTNTTTYLVFTQCQALHQACGDKQKQGMALFSRHGQPVLQSLISGRRFLKPWLRKSHSFSRQGLPLGLWKTYGWAARTDKIRAGWIYTGVHSESWAKAQTEPTGKIKVPLATVGRPDLSQGTWLGGKTDYVRCIVYMSVMY